LLANESIDILELSFSLLAPIRHTVLTVFWRWMGKLLNAWTRTAIGINRSIQLSRNNAGEGRERRFILTPRSIAPSAEFFPIPIIVDLA
jgi:hypothetical protein